MKIWLFTNIIHYLIPQDINPVALLVDMGFVWIITLQKVQHPQDLALWDLEHVEDILPTQ